MKKIKNIRLSGLTVQTLIIFVVSVVFISSFFVADDLHDPTRTGKIFFFAQWMLLVILLHKAGNYYKAEFSFIALGDAYKEINQPREAETQYQLAASMVPHKFYPLYLLVKLYNETGQNEKAVALARQLLNKEAKVSSKAIEEIREEMREVIDSYTVGSDETHEKIKKGKNYTKNSSILIKQQFW